MKTALGFAVAAIAVLIATVIAQHFALERKSEEFTAYRNHARERFGSVLETLETLERLSDKHFAVNYRTNAESYPSRRDDPCLYVSAVSDSGRILLELRRDGTSFVRFPSETEARPAPSPAGKIFGANRFIDPPSHIEPTQKRPP